jgi:ABC-type glycerol-3-phosphate transport system substrate-binding protein
MSYMIHDNPKLKFGMVKPPKGKAGWASFAGGSNLVVLKAGKNKEAAQKWIQFIVNKENSVEYCKQITQLLPVTIAAYDDPFYKEGNNKLFKDILAYAKAYPSLSVWGEIETGVVGEFTAIISEYVSGKLTDDKIKEHLDKANEKLNASLAKEK